MSQATKSSTEYSPGYTKLQIGTLLIKKGYLREEQLEEALEQQARHGSRKLLGEILVDLGYVTDEQVLEVLAGVYGVPYARINPHLADPKVIEVLPRDVLESQCVLPLFLVRGCLTVAVSEPANLFLIDELNRISGHKIRVVAATADDIRSTLRQHLPNANVFVIDDIYEDLNADEFSVVEKQITELDVLEEVAGHSPVVKLVNYLIYSAVNDGASDIHIEPGLGRLRIRYRIDGKLFQKISPPPAMHPAIVSRIKIMSGLDIAERRIPQDGDIHVMLDGRPVDLRISTMPAKDGEKVVIRIIDTSNTVVNVERLGYDPRMLKMWRQVVSQPNGVILVTGPTGSGKSTTLYSVISEMNCDELNISTVEDPVEAGLSGINQFQVNEKAGFTFAKALRSLLRQDPDVLMVGEVRDPETAKIVAQSALTGHLVLSTLHTNDSLSAVTRLTNLEIEPYLVAAILRGVLAQRLVRKICSHCKEEIEIDVVARKAIEEHYEEMPLLYQGSRCGKCRNTGYSGRLGIFELFIPNETVVEAISRGRDLHEMRDVLEEECQYRTLRSDGLNKAAQGLTTVEEVFYATAI